MKTLIFVEIMAFFLIGTGCATYGQLEDHFGKSYATAKKNQILNPAASGNLKPVTGISGKAAELGIGKYTDSFGKTKELENGESSYAANNKDVAGLGQDDYKIVQMPREQNK